MQLKLEITLIFSFILLILISFNSESKELSAAAMACNEAVNQGDANRALTQSEVILKGNSTDYEGLMCKGRALNLQGKYTEALSTMQAAVDGAKQPLEKAVGYILMGDLHQSNNKSAEAIASYKKSLALCEQIDNKAYSRINYNLIGNVQTKEKDLNAALESYTTGLNIAGNANERAESAEYVAKTYHALGNHDKAIEHQLEAVMMQKQAGTLTEYAESALLLGQYFYDDKDYAGAESNYKRLAKFAKDNGGAYYEASANFHLAEVMYASGDHAGAKTLIVDAKQLAEKIGAKQLLTEITAAQKKLNI